MLDSLEQATTIFGGKVLDGHFRHLSKRLNEDVILELSVREALQRHVIDYRQHMEAIKAAAGEDPFAGIIMATAGLREDQCQPTARQSLDVTVVVVSLDFSPT